MVCLRFLALLLLSAGTAQAEIENPFQVEVGSESFSVDPQTGTATLSVFIHLPADHYLYVDKTDLELFAQSGVTIGNLATPSPIKKYDAILKKEVSILQGEQGTIQLGRKITLSAEFRKHMAGGPFLLPMTVRYQGCGPKYCYLPTSTTVTAKIEVGQEAEAFAKGLFGFKATTLQSSLWWLLLAAWVGGLISSLMPCVYPMIPITVAVIGAKQATSVGASFGRGLLFSAGLSLVYAFLGVGAALSGSLLGGWLQSAWLLTAIALFFATMGLSLLGVFTLQLPTALSLRLAKIETNASLVGILITGAITGVVAAPCVGPVVASLLAWVAKLGDGWRGFWLLFFYAQGLSLPFVLLGVFGSQLNKLPKSGLWMEHVKHLMGFGLIAAAAYLIHPHLAPLPYALFLLVLLLGAAWATRSRLFFGKAVSPLVFALLMLAAGGVLFGKIIPQFQLLQQRSLVSAVAWQSDLAAALEQAERENKPIMIDFFAEWCIACKELDEYTYTDAKVGEMSKRFVNVKIDLTKLNRQSEQLTQRYQVLALPAIVFLAPNGKPLPEHRIDGAVPPALLLKTMQEIVSNY